MWGTPQLNVIFSKYSNVVDFSGHSHFPMSDPRSINQSLYTAVGCGAMARFELDGQEYKVPLCSEDFSPDEGQCTLYVKRKNPQTVWVSKYQNRLTAFIGSVMILALWAGLVYAGIFIAGAIKG